MNKKSKSRGFDIRERMYTTEEVAKIIRGTRHTVDGMCARDKLRFIKRGNKRLFPESWLQEDLMKMAKVSNGD